jgi:hypothetical protein
MLLPPEKCFHFCLLAAFHETSQMSKGITKIEKAGDV